MSATSGPAQSNAAGRATLKTLKVSETDTRTRIEITSDKPFTYTSYKASDPAKVVVDISQTEPGAVSTPLVFSTGNLKRIDIVRQPVGGGVLTRVEASLVKDAEFTVTTDPTDKTKLIISLAQPEPEVKGASEDQKEPPLAEVRVEEKNVPSETKVIEAAVAIDNKSAAGSAPVDPSPVKPDAKVEVKGEPLKVVAEPKASAPAAVLSANVVSAAPSPGPAPAPAAKVGAKSDLKEVGKVDAKQDETTVFKGRVLTAVTTEADGIGLAFDTPVETFNAFKLTKPDRIVIDIFSTKAALTQKVISIGALGVANARIGLTPDKVRIVFDALQESLPPYEVVKNGNGLKIRFKPASPKRTSESQAEAAAAPVAQNPAQGSSPALVTPVAHHPAAQGSARLPLAPATATKVVSAPVTPASSVSVPVSTPPAVAVAAAPAVGAAETAAVKQVAQKGAGKISAQSQGALEALDFKIVDGFSRISLKLEGGCIPGKATRGSQGLSLSIQNCQVPKKLQRSLDTSAFGSPVLSVTPYQVRVKGGYVAKFLVKLKGNPPYTVRQEGDTLVWDIRNPEPPRAAKPPVIAVREKVVPPPANIADELAVAPKSEEGMVEIPTTHPAKKIYKGRRVTLEFSDAEVRKIFQLIAEVSNLNFLISDDVSGTISLKLVNVPWDQALDVILDAKELGMQREGNIVQIKPRSRMKNQADEERAARAAAENAMELKTVVFEVNYASVSDVRKQFEAVQTTRGKISVDERTSRIIVKDIQPALDDMRSLLKTLDSPERQVMIEARIVEASSNFTRDLGVQWGLHYRDGSASLANINTIDTGFGGLVAPTGPSSVGNGGIALGMSFGRLTSNIQLDMRLSAAATVGQVKVISTPKVVTLNNKAAKISQGQSIPYQTTSAEGTKTEFVEAALTLEVTPHITADGAVSMKIKASNNSPGTGSPPPINKKEATTELLVANGETTVIGGIYQDSDTETDTGVPFLSDIPLLGWLFKSNAKIKSKTELLIFITPKIVS